MQIPHHRLPSLDLLLSFDAAARHLSFTKAAEERFVTQSAISRQIRSLEDELGVALFRRKHRALALTEEGLLLQASCHDALGKLRETIARLRAPRTRQVLTLTTTPGLASLWLIPRLAAFTRAHPGVDVRIDASLEKRDIEREGIDLAVRYDRVGATEGTKLFDEEVIAVCSPALLTGDGAPLRAPADLARHTLLRLDEAGLPGALQEWPPWLTAMGLADLEPASVLMFSNYDSVISAAIHGQGVALGRRPLVDAMLADGRLAAPFARALASPRAYFVVTSSSAAQRPEVQELVRWLISEGCGSDPGRAAGGRPGGGSGVGSVGPSGNESGAKPRRRSAGL